MRYLRVLLAVLLLLAPVAAHAQNYAIQGLENKFRVESSVANGRRGPVVYGYVYNLTGYTADRVRLSVENANGGGSTIGEVMGTVPADNRAYFEIPVKDAGTYRVRVLSYDPVGRGGL